MRVDAADMAMPKAAPHLDNLSPACEYQIWLTWKDRLVKSKSVTQSVQQAAHSYLRLRIFASNLAHILAAPGFGQEVHH
jgi:hypothetical protein